MSERYRKIIDAIVVVAFAVFLCAAGQADRENARREELAAAHGGEDSGRTEAAADLPSDSGIFAVMDQEAGGVTENTGAGAGNVREAETENAGPDTEEDAVGVYPDTEEDFAAVCPDPDWMPDLSDECTVILHGISREAVAGYPVDDTFLMWLYARCGEESLRGLAQLVSDGGMNAGCWQELTGSTIHALWAEYCMESGYQSVLLEEDCRVADTEAGGAATLGFIGDTRADVWELVSDVPETETEVAEMPTETMETEVVKTSGGTSHPEAGEESAARIPDDLLAAMCGMDQIWATDPDADKAPKDQEIRYFVAHGRKIGLVRVSLAGDPALSEAASSGDALLAQAAARISEAKEQCDTVIVLVRWGTVGNLYPDAAQPDAAKVFAAAGADAVIGSGPRRLQGVTYVSGIPVAYSLGNFCSSDGLLYTALLQVTVDENGLARMRYLPCIQDGEGARLLTAQEETDAFYHYVMAHSRGVGMDAEGNVVNMSAAGTLPAEAIPVGEIRYEPGASTTPVSGMGDINGIPIDPVGNYK